MTTSFLVLADPFKNFSMVLALCSDRSMELVPYNLSSAAFNCYGNPKFGPMSG
jgi:hypothetical protein